MLICFEREEGEGAEWWITVKGYIINTKKDNNLDQRRLKLLLLLLLSLAGTEGIKVERGLSWKRQSPPLVRHNKHNKQQQIKPQWSRQPISYPVILPLYSSHISSQHLILGLVGVAYTFELRLKGQERTKHPQNIILWSKNIYITEGMEDRVGEGPLKMYF